MLKSRLIFAANRRRFFHIIESDSTDMNDQRPGVKTLIQLFFLLILSTGTKIYAQDGAAIFQQNCASCHAVNKKLTGPALAGVEDRWSDKAKLHAWIHIWLSKSTTSHKRLTHLTYHHSITKSVCRYSWSYIKWWSICIWLM